MANPNGGFETLYLAHKGALERYIFHKIAVRADAEDVLQEVWLAAYTGFSQLHDAANSRAWLIGIASHKCADFYARKYKNLEIPLENAGELPVDDHGRELPVLIRDTLMLLPDKGKQALYLFYIKGFSQRDIAARLGIPLGTVKSRISAAKQNFRSAFPYPPVQKGGNRMNQKKFPAFMPAYSIEKLDGTPAPIRFEEISGWIIVPRVGEKVSFAFYDDPDRRLTGINNVSCVRDAEIHGIPCVQVEVDEEDEDGRKLKRTLFLRMTETHVAYVAEMSMRGDTLYFGSFMDDEWLKRYYLGENNIGREIFQEAKGIARINPDGSITVDREEYPDIIGRYLVRIGDRKFDTVALLEVCKGIMTILYIGQNGRTVLFTRYNRFDWKQEIYKQLWTDRLPESERLTVNGDVYVHWYNCIADYAL